MERGFPMFGKPLYFHTVNETPPYSLPKLSIKAWAEDDRPREKMLSKGREAISNAELIGILIGSGTREESAIDIAKRILASVDNDLNKLGELALKDLMKFKGIGEARAINIASALELGRRRKAAQTAETPRISCSKDSYDILYPHLADLKHEQMYLLLLNRGNRHIGTVRVAQGGVSGTVADIKLILKAAIDSLASAIIIAHNHPSGNLTPSDPDKSLTKKLYQAADLMGIVLLDHIIVAGKSYFSFKDEGLL